MKRFPQARRFDLGDDISLLEAGMIDSLGILDLVTFVHTTFGIRIDDDDLSPDNFGSIGALVRFVEGKR
jgi:acyl carrier protein